MVALLRLPPVCFAVASMIGMINPIVAQESAGAAGGDRASAYDHMAFDAADTDGDGFVSEAELARDAAAGFSRLDQDRSGTLKPQELEPHDPADFARVDRNGDGVLTFNEVMSNKVRAFEAGDTNKDGFLSFDEMVAVVEAEQGQS